MKIKQFEVAGLAQYSYVVSSEGDAIVIDPMRDFEQYTDYAADKGLAITHVTETHVPSCDLDSPHRKVRTEAHLLRTPLDTIFSYVVVFIDLVAVRGGSTKCEEM